MKFKRFKRDYLIFSKKERNAALVLISLISFTMVLPFVEHHFAADSETRDYSSMEAQFKLIQNEDPQISGLFHDGKRNINYENQFAYLEEDPDTELTRSLFYFDPNKITQDEWIRIGISESIANRIFNYIEKGGQFRKKEDLLKIYGFSRKDFDAIEEYIRIETPTDKNWLTPSTDNLPKPMELQMTEINSSGVAELIALGFTDELANRILKFRNGVGGIYSVEQLSDVYGMNIDLLDTVKAFITIDANLLQTIPINSCSFEQLANHSYISDELAQSIVDYRAMTGRFVSITEVLKVKGMYPRLFEKLKPYLTL